MPAIEDTVRLRPKSRNALSLEPSRVQSPRLNSKSPPRVTRKDKHETGVSMTSYVLAMSGYKPGPLIHNSQDMEIGTILSNRL